MEAKQDPRFLKGIEEFNRGLYFECHETLEEIWWEEHGQDREFYQGIIQIAAGYFKWEQGVLIGAIKLWRSGLEKLEPYGPVHLDLNLHSFTQSVRDHLSVSETAYEGGKAPPELKVPVLSVVS